MTVKMLQADSEGLSLIKAESRIPEGTVVIRIALPGDETHLIALPPFALRHAIDGGCVHIYSDQSTEPIRTYGSWLWVDQIGMEPAQRPRAVVR